MRIVLVSLALLSACSTRDAGSAPDAAKEAAGTPEDGSNACSFTLEFDPSECRDECQLPLQQYCEAVNWCVPLDAWQCRGSSGLINETIEEGCGFVRFSYSGDVQDVWGRTYDKSTGALVFMWNNGKRSSGCQDPIRAGTEPSCETWQVVPCTDAGR
jgi:hypothetical protein